MPIVPVGEAAPVADEGVAGTGCTEEPRDASIPVRGVRRSLFPIWNRFAIVGGQRDAEGGEFSRKRWLRQFGSAIRKGALLGHWDLAVYVGANAPHPPQGSYGEGF